MFDDDEVLVGRPLGSNVKLLLVSSIVFNGDGVFYVLVRTEDVESQSARVTFCGTADVDLVTLCDNGSGRNCGEERLFQVNRNSCILSLSEGTLVSGRTGCIDGVCTGVKTAS